MLKSRNQTTNGGEGTLFLPTVLKVVSLLLYSSGFSFDEKDFHKSVLSPSEWECIVLRVALVCMNSIPMLDFHVFPVLSFAFSEWLEEAALGAATSGHLKPEILKALYHFSLFQATWLKFFSLILFFYSHFYVVEIQFLWFMWSVIIDDWNASLLREIVKAKGQFLFKNKRK